MASHIQVKLPMMMMIQTKPIIMQVSIQLYKIHFFPLYINTLLCHEPNTYVTICNYNYLQTQIASQKTDKSMHQVQVLLTNL